MEAQNDEPPEPQSHADDRVAICLMHETGTAPGGDRFDNRVRNGHALNDLTSGCGVSRTGAGRSCRVPCRQGGVETAGARAHTPRYGARDNQLGICAVRASV
jgi:hypothetical protein